MMHEFRDEAQGKRPIKKIVCVGIYCILVCFSLFAVMKIISSDPNIPLLSDDGRAKWIKVDIPVSLGIWKDEYQEAYFRKSFTVPATKTSQTMLTLRAMKSGRLNIIIQLQ